MCYRMASLRLPQLPGLYIRRKVSPQRTRGRRRRPQELDFIIVVGLVPVSPRPPASGRTTALRGGTLPPLPRPDHFHPCKTVYEEPKPKPELPREQLLPSTELLSRWGD